MKLFVFIIILSLAAFVTADIQKKPTNIPLYFDYYSLKSVYLNIPQITDNHIGMIVRKNNSINKYLR